MFYKTHRQRITPYLTIMSHLDLQILEVKHHKACVVTCKKGVYTAKITDDHGQVIDSRELETHGQFYQRTGEQCNIHLYSECPNFPEYVEVTAGRDY